MNNLKKIDITSATLHIMAMLFMLCDHMWATIIPGNDWLTCIGRIAFPIFAFMIVEGYFHTGNLRKYVIRLLLLALVSEIPFNLMYSSSWIFPFHQNVIWTLLMGLGLIHVNECVGKRGKSIFCIFIGAITVVVGFFVGLITMVDYNGVGVLTVLVFYFFRQRKWWSFFGQLVVLYYLNVEVLGGFYYEVSILGMNFQLVQQGLALLALIPIWLYRGRQGYHSKWFRYLCYSFYPMHMLLLYILRI